MYLDKVAATLYGPKTSGSWGVGISLRGATGANGASGAAGAAGTPGSKILSGSGVPAASLGVVGDYYLDKTNGNLYGPKTANGWGTPFSLKGPKGDKGDKGDTGTANVIYSNWILITAPESVYTFTISAPELKEDILDKGVVLVYVKMWLTKTEYTIIQLGIPSSIFPYYFIPKLGLIELYSYENLNSDGISRTPLNNLEFRYILIPGGVPARKMNVNYDNYDEVINAYGLQN